MGFKSPRPYGSPWCSLLLLLAACAPLRPPISTPAATGEGAVTARAGSRTLTVLSVNDVYRIEGIDNGAAGGLARLRALRAELEHEAPELLLLHAGDFLFPSLLSRSYSGKQMIDVMNLLDGDANAFDDRMFTTFGNHEFDKSDSKDADILDLRIEESQFHWLGTNIDFKSTEDGRPVVAADHLVNSALLDRSGIRVGLFSLSTDEKYPDYVHSFGQPKAVARRMTAELRRQGAELVIALTHLPVAEDLDLLRKLGADGPDLIIGGHEHNRQSPQDADGRRVLKADADAISAVVARVTIDGQNPPTVDFEFRDLGASAPADPEVQAAIDRWTRTHNEVYCHKLGQPAGCLETEIGRTRPELTGEELEIRRFETNFGNWMMDQALKRFADQGVQAAFVNSGSLRLNQNIPANSAVTLRHIEETFQYSSDLRILSITGDVLAKVVAHSVTDWTGNGKWLQISGFAFRHDPENATADRLTLLTPEGPRPVEPEEELLVLTSAFLATPATGQDGYKMLTEDHLMTDQPVDGSGEPITLESLVISGLKAAGEAGISPQVEGRICNPQRPGPCLAIAR